MLVKISRPASALPFPVGGIICVGVHLFAVRSRYSVIARASCRVRRSSSSLELFSSMKKCGIFVLGPKLLGAQIHELINCGDSFAVSCLKSVPTLRFSYVGMLSIW